MSLTDYAENILLNHAFGAVIYSPPGTWYYGLSTTSPNDDGSGITEPVGNGYSRVAVINNTSNFPNASAGNKRNGQQIQFPTASGSWGAGTIGYFFVSDAAGGGNVFVKGPVTTPRAVGTGDAPIFDTNTFSLILD